MLMLGLVIGVVLCIMVLAFRSTFRVEEGHLAVLVTFGKAETKDGKQKLGERVVRRCGPGLACVPRPVAPRDPASRETLSAEGDNCGGVGAIPCGEGLGCQLLTSEDVMAKDAMGTCQRESVCEPEAAAPQ